MNVLVGKNPYDRGSIEEKERSELAEIISNSGFKCLEFSPSIKMIKYADSLNPYVLDDFKKYLAFIYYWPRDSFIYLKNRNVLLKDFYKEFHLAEGGFSVNSFLDDEVFFLSEYFNDEDLRDAQKELGDSKIFLIKNGLCADGKKLRHLDLSVFYSGEYKTLFVDANHYPIDYRQDFKSVEESGVSVVFFKEKDDVSFNYYPANCLSIPSGNKKEVIFSNIRSLKFNKLLRNDYGADLISVNVDKNSNYQGSIRCMTNVFESFKPEKFIKRMNDINLKSFKLFMKKNYSFYFANQ